MNRVTMIKINGIENNTMIKSLETFCRINYDTEYVELILLCIEYIIQVNVYINITPIIYIE